MDALFKVGTETAIGEHIDFSLKEFFQGLAKLNQIEKATATFHVHEEVDIAFRACLSSHHGAEYPHVLGSVFPRKAQYFCPIEFQYIRGSHSALLIVSPV